MKRFLLVNYPAPIQKTLSNIIKKAFLDAQIVKTNVDADRLDQLDTKCVDLLIVDIANNNKEGIRLLEQVKNQYPGLPVLIISAYRRTCHAIAAFSAGADGFLREGAAFSELALAARTILAGEKYFPVAVREPLHAIYGGNAMAAPRVLGKYAVLSVQPYYPARV